MQHLEIEVILMRQLADRLAQSVFLVDAVGTLLYYNRAAEQVLGHRYEETGEMPVEVWSTLFVPADAQGQPLPPEGLPLVRTLQDRRPAHRSFWVKGMDGVLRQIEVTALPLLSDGERLAGAVAIFWEVNRG